MYEITFQFENGAQEVKFSAAPGSTILEAAKSANVAIDAPCNGNGSCGKCRVKLVSGEVTGVQTGHISDEDYAAGWRLSCSTKPAGDITVLVPDIASAYQSRMKTADLSSGEEIAIFNQLQQDVSDLTKQVANLTDALKADGTDGTDSTQNQGKDSSNVDSSLMLPALSGSGVTVTLDDSPLWENAVNNNGTTANINDYVIHQQDVESVVNALWAGGADALMIMDQRVLFNSAVICSGNVLSLHGKKYSPPFTISAIGDPQRLRAALNDSEAITILKQYVTAFGIGYKVENAEDLQFPATAALLQQLKYATVDTSKTTDEEQTQQ